METTANTKIRASDFECGKFILSVIFFNGNIATFRRINTPSDYLCNLCVPLWPLWLSLGLLVSATSVVTVGFLIFPLLTPFLCVGEVFALVVAPRGCNHFQIFLLRFPLKIVANSEISASHFSNACRAFWQTIVWRCFLSRTRRRVFSSSCGSRSNVMFAGWKFLASAWQM